MTFVPEISISLTHNLMFFFNQGKLIKARGICSRLSPAKLPHFFLFSPFLNTTCVHILWAIGKTRNLRQCYRRIYFSWPNISLRTSTTRLKNLLLWEVYWLVPVNVNNLHNFYAKGFFSLCFLTLKYRSIRHLG